MVFMFSALNTNIQSNKTGPVHKTPQQTLTGISFSLFWFRPHKQVLKKFKIEKWSNDCSTEFHPDDFLQPNFSRISDWHEGSRCVTDSNWSLCFIISSNQRLNLSCVASTDPGSDFLVFSTIRSSLTVWSLNFCLKIQGHDFKSESSSDVCPFWNVK